MGFLFRKIVEKIRFFPRMIGALIKKDIILFESVPELSGSPWMIYEEMLRRKLDRKYKLVWAVDLSYVSSKGIACIPFYGKNSVLKKIMHKLYLLRVKIIVENNRFVYKINPRTFRLHAQHGAPLKNASSYNKQIGDVDAVLSLSNKMVELEQKIFSLPKDKFVVLGYPSNDGIFCENDLYKNGFMQQLSKSSQKYSKIIGWLPTFRQHKKSGASSDYVFPFGVPLLQVRRDFQVLNDLLNRENILLVIQMHHAQAKNFPVQNYSNIVMVTPELKEKYSVSTANLMHNFDALITDYSAAYHEYLLLNRPVALSIDDYEEYAKNPGFSLSYFDWIKGVYLKNVTDLIKFIEDVSNGVDSAKVDREAAMHRIHQYIDNQSTQRVVDFLIEKVNL